MEIRPHPVSHSKRSPITQNMEFWLIETFLYYKKIILDMKSSELHEEIKENLKDYPIEYLRNKVTDDRYKDPLTKKLAKYNSETWNEIFALNITEDYEIKDNAIKNLKKDIDYYFDTYAGGDEETREFTKYICLYLAFMAKRPLHPVGDNPAKDQVFLENGEYKCKTRIMSIKDENSLCRYCICKNAGFSFGF